ncbi:MAG: ATP-dependent helicase HrpB [Pseudomonadota bacterium]
MKLPDYPALVALPALRAALAQRGCAVLAAPPGSGKTTTVPLALLNEPWLRGKKILMLEPRRLAARTSAARMAYLLGEKTGETVGYQIRFERRVSSRTRIEVITEGLLARRLQADPELPGVGLVICDEFHERSLDADLALALTLDARANLNPELRVLVMSATLDTARVAKLLGDAPLIEADGRLHPVDILYKSARGETELDEITVAGVLTALAETPGDILVFLPGAREIRDTQRRLEARVRNTAIYALFGDLSSSDQDAALAPDPQGRRKVILATNIAQTSLTVEGVTTVVDAGYVRAARFDAASGANRLETLRVSRASADQRAGRAGRLGPGYAYRLWSAEQHGHLPAHDTPEILASDLTRFALELAAWGTAPEKLALLDQPPASAWAYAQELLRETEALDTAGRITAHGRELARLPAAPRIAHMLLKARAADLSYTAAWVAAVLEGRDSSGQTDLAVQVAAAASGRGDPNIARRQREAARQFLRLLDEPERDERVDEGAVGRVLGWAYPERLARRRPEQLKTARDVAYLCADGGEARLMQSDALSHQEWLAIAHWDPQPPRKIRSAAAVRFADIERDHAAQIETVKHVRWNSETESIVAEEQRRIGAIVLATKPLRDAEALRATMIEGVRSLGIEALPWNETVRQWQARVLSLRAWRPDEGWPDVSDAALLASLNGWLAPFLDSVTRRDHLARVNLADALNAMLDYDGQRKLAKWAPTHLAVPTGSQIALEYFIDGRSPALKVKLQEMFGCAKTPTVNDGRTPVVLHLLSPAREPAAVTQDLAGFWARGYTDVRKDLRGQYPRHPWPDDPLTAPPTRRAKPRGT